MSNLVLPEIARIQITTWKEGREIPFALPNVIFCVHIFARHKNDYFLAPFFSDENGQVIITRQLCEIYVEAELLTGLMDYQSIGNAYSFVEIFPFTIKEVSKAIEARKLWGLIGREKDLWDSVDELVLLYEKSFNNKLNEHCRRSIRDDWNGSKPEYEYSINLR